jgi:hypothetical protein
MLVGSSTYLVESSLDLVELTNLVPNQSIQTLTRLVWYQTACQVNRTAKSDQFGVGSVESESTDFEYTNMNKFSKGTIYRNKLKLFVICLKDKHFESAIKRLKMKEVTYQMVEDF